MLRLPTCDSVPVGAMPWAGPEKREAELGTPRGTRPSTPPPKTKRHGRRRRHLGRAGAHDSAQLGARAVGGASGDGPRWRPRDAQAHFERMLPQRSKIPPSAVCAFPLVSSKAFSFVMIPSVPMSITPLLSAIRAVFLNK